MIENAQVFLWGTRIGVIVFADGLYSFQYDRDFQNSQIEVSPITMPLSGRVYSFPELNIRSFHGLPGLLADSLPDKFGNRLINEWLSRQGRDPDSMSAVERLCYIGHRGMGALEFVPDTGDVSSTSTKIELEPLIELASEILSRRSDMRIKHRDAAPDSEQMQQILSVGTSAGGARAKAIIAWNEKTKEIRSGQINAGKGFDYWILKFDGVSGNKDNELDDPQGYGLIEYAYYLMATDSGIDMTECRLLRENQRSHFMTRRFDRTGSFEKIHMQTLGALAHFDYNSPGSYSYEQALSIMKNDLNLSTDQTEALFRRMTFNIIARNQDDHVKNIAFLMDKGGRWTLSPAYDINYSYNPDGNWTNQHQMLMNGKRDRFSREDFRECARTVSMKRGRSDEILDEVLQSIKKWKEFAARAGIQEQRMKAIQSTFRMTM